MRKLIFTIFFLLLPLATAQAETTTQSLIIRVPGTWGDTYNSLYLLWESDGNSTGTLYINGTPIGGAKGNPNRFFQHTDKTYIEQDLTSRSLRFRIAGSTVAILTQSGSFTYLGDIYLCPFAAPTATDYVTFDTDNNAFVFAVYTGSGFVKVASMSATRFQISTIRLGSFPVFAMGYPTQFFEIESITDDSSTNGQWNMWEVTTSELEALE